MQEIRRRNWHAAYAMLANKSEFQEADFVRDLTGSYTSLRSYAGLESFDLSPQRATADEAKFRATLNWSSVVGAFQDVRELRVVKEGDRWQVEWPINREPKLPPQVIPVNYLRWDVIYRGAEDDWGAQDVESPHVRIVAMHPVDRGGGTIILGELLNEDVVPAFVTVKATLLAKDGSDLATEDSFANISHVLLPKQVTPFRIDFPTVRLSQVDNVRIDPSSTLVAASADPVIGIEDQKLNPLPTTSLSGQLVNQSGQVVNIAHILGTFYDSRGQILGLTECQPRVAAPDPGRLSLLIRRPGRQDQQLPRGDQHVGVGEMKTDRRAVGRDADEFDRGGRLFVCGRQRALQFQSGGSSLIPTRPFKSRLVHRSPAQVLRRNVEPGEAVVIAAGDLHNAGHYLALLAGQGTTEKAEFDVVAAGQPASLNFLAKPSRLPVSRPDGISGVAYVFDVYRNLVREPTPVSFELSDSAGGTQSRSVPTRNGVAWVKMASAPRAGAAKFQVSVGSVSDKRVVQQVPGDPCNLKMSAQRSGQHDPETAPVLDCSAAMRGRTGPRYLCQTYDGPHRPVTCPLDVACTEIPARSAVIQSHRRGLEMKLVGGQR